MPARWPAFAALAAVVVLSLGMVVVDLFVDRETANRTGELVDDSLRSVMLIDDMRKASHLLATSREPEIRTQALAQLSFDIREFDPLAISLGERHEWARLRGLLHGVRIMPAVGTTTDISAIEGSIDNIVELNRLQAERAVATIQRTDTHGILIDVTGGLITLVLAGAVAIWLRGAIARERELLRRHLDHLEGRRRDLEAFAGRVAHDLRGPLAPLRTCADLIALKAPEARPLGERVARATDRMSAIIDGLLALSVSGNPGPGEAEVAPIVRDVVDELEPQLAGARVALTLDGSTARCSPAVLHQLLDNLVSNAVKYRSPARPLELAIRSMRADGVVELEISDNGIGMDAETALHAFEPLYRARDVGNLPGHGLGLAIVKRTVDALGGTCSLATTVDHGTCVRLRLPAVTDRAHAA